MKTCVLYCSHTGNTKRFAEAIGDLLKAPIFDVTTSEPSVADDFELLIIGTPAIGLRPAPEVSSFVKRLPECKGKKIILFGTYAVRMGGALKILEKELAEKGCVTLLGVSRRVLRKGKADFSEALAEIKKVAEKQARHTEQ
jgi:flavodoxin